MPETKPETANARARTTWRSWVFRGYVGITCLIALWVALADPFALADETRGGLYAYLFPPLLFVGLMLGLGWLATLVFSRRTEASDREVARQRGEE